MTTTTESHSNMKIRKYSLISAALIVIGMSAFSADAPSRLNPTPAAPPAKNEPLKAQDSVQAQIARLQAQINQLKADVKRLKAQQPRKNP